MRNQTATRGDARRSQRAPKLMRWLAVATLGIGGVVVGGGPTQASFDTVPAENRDVFDVLHLRCVGSDVDAPQIACRWTMPDGAASVKVLRVVVGSGEGRQTVYRTSDPSDNTFVDSSVRRGVRYLYVVRAFDDNARLVAASRPAVAGVAVAPDPTVEVLRLDCSATAAVQVRCRWTAPGTPARVLTLWRSVDGGPRERVASFANPFPTSYGDVVPAATSRAVYAVIATDGDGEIVARSRADGVTFPSDEIVTRPVGSPGVDPAPRAEVDPEDTTPSQQTETPAPATARTDIDEQPAPTTSMPIVTVPAGPRVGSDRAAGTGERDRAG